MPVINPGLMNHSITIQQKSVSGQNARGEDQYTWAYYASCMMRVRALNNREVFAFAQQWPNAQSMLEGYHIAGVTAAMRLYDQCCSRYFDIRAVDDVDGTREQLRILAQEVAA